MSGSLINRLKSLFAISTGRPHPVSLIHFLTERCNARCKHCFIDFSQRTDEMTLDEIAEITQKLNGHILNVYLTGGEPFLRGDLDEIVRLYLRNVNPQWLFLTSNGSMPGKIENFCKQLVDENVTNNLILTFSIDDFADQHDANRGVKGLFDKALESYRIVHATGLKNLLANLAITVTPWNAERVEDLYDHLCSEHGVESITVNAMRAEGVASFTDRQAERQMLEAYAKLTTKINDAASVGGIGRIIGAKNRVFYPIQQSYLADPRYLSRCPAATLFGVLGADGGIRGCEVLDDEIGNIRDFQYSLPAAWKSSEAKRLRKKVLSTKCHCSFECAWSLNLLWNKRYWPSLLAELLKS